MEFDNTFDVPLPPAQAWALLMDIPRIAPCMPGAELTEILDPQNYRGKIAVRLGPVALTFAGRIEFDQIDTASHTARVKAQGSDAKGRGGANATAAFRIEPAGAGSTVRIHTELMLSGAVRRPVRDEFARAACGDAADAGGCLAAGVFGNTAAGRQADFRSVAHGPRHLVEACGPVQRKQNVAIIRHHRQTA
jgi:carbon monoxide dehydrogenase subunit G